MYSSRDLWTVSTVTTRCSQNSPLFPVEQSHSWMSLSLEDDSQSMGAFLVVAVVVFVFVVYVLVVVTTTMVVGVETVATNGRQILLPTIKQLVRLPMTPRICYWVVVVPVP